MAESASCPVCGEPSGSGKKFCGNCGSRLDPDTAALAQQIRTIVSQELQDQKLVESETTEAIVSRVSKWAKLFAFFAGVPTFVLLAILTILGLRSFDQAESKIDHAVSDVEDHLKNARETATRLNTDSQDLDKRFAKLKADVQTYEALKNDVQVLRQAVSNIEKRVFEVPPGFPSQTLSQLDATLAKLQQYVRDAGYNTPLKEIHVRIPPKDQQMPCSGYVSCFQKGDIWVARTYASDASYVLREYMHSVLDGIDPATDASVNQHWAFYALESGLGSYFPASILDRARVTGWNLDDRQKWNANTPVDWSEIESVRGAISASVFWSVRKTIKRETLDPALLRSWLGTKQSYGDERFAAVFTSKLIRDLGTRGPEASKLFSTAGMPF